MRRECWERFPRHRLQRKPLVSDPCMHHGTCVTPVPWCMSGSLIRGGGENVRGIPGACTTRSFTYLARSPSIRVNTSIIWKINWIYHNKIFFMWCINLRENAPMSTENVVIVTQTHPMPVNERSMLTINCNVNLRSRSWIFDTIIISPFGLSSWWSLTIDITMAITGITIRCSSGIYVSTGSIFGNVNIPHIHLESLVLLKYIIICIHDLHLCIFTQRFYQLCLP